MWSPRRRDGAGSRQTDFTTELWLRASRGEKPSIPVVCALDPLQVPTCANTYIFAVQRRVNPVSVAAAPGTLLAAVTLPVVVWVVAR
jgi:hypothetical protein